MSEKIFLSEEKLNRMKRLADLVNEKYSSRLMDPEDEEDYSDYLNNYLKQVVKEWEEESDFIYIVLEESKIPTQMSDKSGNIYSLKNAERTGEVYYCKYSVELQGKKVLFSISLSISLIVTNEGVFKPNILTMQFDEVL